ncbi:hypothetical protein Bca52824_023921 [Brassica carinata]|uniref:DUF6821 domain-containing protein n=1 Tax=Brassica carinata TaxID=52824 RepID=A0A8X7VJH5_BRACI|nr:hypothetical protein Bca52824_023921 [Brassica carinata]
MDGEEMLDWELVHGSDTDSNTSEKESSVIDDGLIVSDHFSADHRTTEQSIGSGDSSRVDYGSEYPNPVGLGFDRLNIYQSGDGGVRDELGFFDGEVKVSDFQTESLIEDASKCLSETDNLQVESQAGVEEHVEDASKCLSESEGNELVSGDSGVVSGEEEIVSDSEAVEGSGGDVVAVDSAVRASGDESKSRETVWWKMPFVLVKYYAFRIGPVWSVSMAAAVMGFVLLGRRLYHMKKKAQRFHLKVAIDEKKVSRVMSQAARLNEAFTEVRRVPVIRPALPSPGAWPVLSLR